MRRCAAVVLWAMLVMCSAAMAGAQSGEPQAPIAVYTDPSAPRLTFEGNSLVAKVYTTCTTAPRVTCYHHDPPRGGPPPPPPSCPHTALCVTPGGGLFISTRRAAKSVKVTINSRRVRTYRATARRWAVALPPTLPETGGVRIDVTYRDAVVTSGLTLLNAR